MADATRFTATHVSFVAARAAELEQLGETQGDPNALVRAARLYTLAVRMADEIDNRATEPFTRADLAQVRDELRVLASDAVATTSMDGGHRSARDAEDSAGAMTSAFREIALRIEQRLTADDAGPRIPPDAESRA